MTTSSTPPTHLQPTRFIWQHPDWPQLTFNAVDLSPAVEAARLEQGKLVGLLDAIGLVQAQELAGALWVQEAVSTAAIEGENLDLGAVRSSVAYRLGLGALKPFARDVDGLIDVMQDATQACDVPLDHDRLWRWQSALFPGGTSGVRRIAVGRYREHADAMQIVSGLPGREVVHYEAPPSSGVMAEMTAFLQWFEATRPRNCMASPLNGLVRAGMAHLWFEAIHPFEDGNGRVGRALVDMALAQDRGAPSTAAYLFGMSRQMLSARARYYGALNAASRSATGHTPDITAWLVWFVEAFTHSCTTSQAVVKQVLDKAAFRLKAAECGVSLRQTKVLNRLLEAGSEALGGGFLGGLTADKYSKITQTSKATATRDLADLLAKGLLQVDGVGKATRYAIAIDHWSQPAV